MQRWGSVGLVLLLGMACASCASQPKSVTEVSSVGPVADGVSLPLDQEAAVRVAEQLFIRTYGEQVLKERPWTVTDKGATFEVCGTLPADMVGGVAELEIRKDNLQIVRLIHSK